MKSAHVVHHVPGRVRIRVPGAGQGLHQLADQVAAVPGIESVRTSPHTDSMIIHYDEESPGAGQPDAAQAIKQLLNIAMPEEAQASERIVRALELESDYLTKHSVTARRLVHFVRGLNARLKLATDNSLDLPVLLPAGLAVLSALTARKSRPSPLWITLLIFSFNSFLELHKVPDGARLTHDKEVGVPSKLLRENR